MDFWTFSTNNPIYNQLLELRYQVMRLPLGLSFTLEDLASDTTDAHIGGFLDNTLVACCVMHPISSDVVKMRQVAVLPQYQKKGYGRQIVLYTEQWAKYAGYQKITLHARDYAIKFYEKLNYSKEGDLFDEIGILHLKMHKTI